MSDTPQNTPPASPSRSQANTWVYRTCVFIVAFIGVALVYDLVIFLLYGGPATISTQMGRWWQNHKWVWFLWCLLTGHLLWMAPTQRTPAEWLETIGIGAAGIATGIFITWLRG